MEFHVLRQTCNLANKRKPIWFVFLLHISPVTPQEACFTLAGKVMLTIYNPKGFVGENIGPLCLETQKVGFNQTGFPLARPGAKLLPPVEMDETGYISTGAGCSSASL